MSGCHEVRPLLPARPEELTPEQALLRADHVLACNRCAAEAAGYSRLGAALAVLAGFEAEPPYGTLERILATLGRRRVAVADPKIAAVAAGSVPSCSPTPCASAAALPPTARARDTAAPWVCRWSPPSGPGR
jgi:hypothetical protein